MTVTVLPTPTPSQTIDVGAADAQFVVDVFCGLSERYFDFDAVAIDLQRNPARLADAIEGASEFAFALRGLPTRLSIGPAGGWSDSWLALAAFQSADAVDASLPYFESAQQANTAEEFISLYFGVLSNPVNRQSLDFVLPLLSSEQLTELGTCTRT